MSEVIDDFVRPPILSGPIVKSLPSPIDIPPVVGHIRKGGNDNNEPLRKHIRFDDSGEPMEEDRIRISDGSAEVVEHNVLEREGPRHEGEGSAANGVATVSTVPPEIRSPTNMVCRRVFRTVNRFTINLSDIPTMPTITNDFVKDIPVYRNVAHVLPFKCSELYMNRNEFTTLQYSCAKYKYERARIKFNNFTTHVGNLTGTSDIHFSINYGGISTFLGVTSNASFGHWYITQEDKSLMDTNKIYEHFSDPMRDMYYRNYPCHLSLLPTVKDLQTESYAAGGKVLHDQIDVKQCLMTYPNILGRAYTSVGTLPVTDFTLDFSKTNRWRRPRFYDKPSAIYNDIRDESSQENSSQDFYADIAGLCPSYGPTLHLKAATHASGKQVVFKPTVGMNMVPLPSDNVCPNGSIFYSSSPSGPGPMYRTGPMNHINNPSTAIVQENFERKTPVDLIYFGFLVPITKDASMPNVFVSFELECNLEVLYVPQLSEYDSERDWQLVFNYTAKDIKKAGAKTLVENRMYNDILNANEETTRRFVHGVTKSVHDYPMGNIDYWYNYFINNDNLGEDGNFVFIDSPNISAPNEWKYRTSSNMTKL